MTTNSPSDTPEAELRNDISASIYGLYYYELPKGAEREVIDRIMQNLNAYISKELKAVIGDDSTDQNVPLSAPFQRNIGMNQLRAEQRQRAKDRGYEL